MPCAPTQEATFFWLGCKLRASIHILVKYYAIQGPLAARVMHRNGSPGLCNLRSICGLAFGLVVLFIGTLCFIFKWSNLVPYGQCSFFEFQNGSVSWGLSNQQDLPVQQSTISKRLSAFINRDDLKCLPESRSLSLMRQQTGMHV